MPTQEISFSFKARYAKLGVINGDTKQLYFVLHGQGQLANYFIEKFKVLETPNTCIIAPEGLSRYYLDGFAGRVGATWMTKENRIADIENYIQFLNAVYTKEVGNYNSIERITILGFSQGAATASRWAINGSIRFHRLILWGGLFPPDMDFDKGHDILNTKETYLVYGKSDPFLSDDRFSEMHDLASRLKIKPTAISFEGKHEIDQETLLRFI